MSDSNVRPLPAERQKTLVFCTSHVSSHSGPTNSWDHRYRIWVDAIRASHLQFDQMLMIDDGSATLPDWPDAYVMDDDLAVVSAAPLVLFHFNHVLGRRGVSDFPGWVRSFFFAARYAGECGFTKVVHIESDAFLISKRIQDWVNGLTEGWNGLWCPRWARPESGIQVIAGKAMQAYVDFAGSDIESLAGVVVETALPFTHIEHGFCGDRWGEFLDHIPRNADWSMQTQPPLHASREMFYWWLSGAKRGNLDFTAYSRRPTEPPQHIGPYFPALLTALDEALGPCSYLDIGTGDGASLRSFSCDAVSIDTQIHQQPDMLRTRTRCLLVQQSSDVFFTTDILRQMFPAGLDIAYLHGLHFAESMLSDFINAELHCHPRSLILMPDCLPLNVRMAERRYRRVEDEPTGDYWTGDVWKMLPILLKYRPELRLLAFDCAPTGLIAVTGLDPTSSVLRGHRAAIEADFASLILEEFTLQRLWSLAPLLDSARLIENSIDLHQLFALRD